MANDTANLEHIRSFLKGNQIEYTEPELGVFDMKGGKGDGIQIRYANSTKIKIGYKRFGYEGVRADYCYQITIEQEKRGIRVLWWKDFELDERFGPAAIRKRNVIQSYILAATGKIPTKIYGRDCEVRVINNKEARPFLEANSLYGFRSASSTYGLYNKKAVGVIPAGTLVMLISLGHPYYGKDLYDLEVLRSSTLLNVQVLGGASKLMKHIFSQDEIKVGEKTIKWNSVVFYVDQCHNNGNSLESLGFKFWKDTKGGLMNIDLVKGETFNRRPAQHKQIMAMMAEGRVVASPLCGTRNFVYCKNGDYTKYGIESA